MLILFAILYIVVNGAWIFHLISALQQELISCASFMFHPHIYPFTSSVLERSPVVWWSCNRSYYMHHLWNFQKNNKERLQTIVPYHAKPRKEKYRRDEQICRRNCESKKVYATTTMWSEGVRDKYRKSALATRNEQSSGYCKVKEG